MAAGRSQGGGIGMAAGLECRLDQVPFAHGKTGMHGAEALGQGREHGMIAAAFGKGCEQLAGDLQPRVARGGVQIVMFEEHGRRQDDIGIGRGVGQELLVHDREQILAREAGTHLAELGRDAQRVGVLDEHGLDRRPVAQIARIAGQHRADARLVEHAHRRVTSIEALDQRLVEVIDVAVAPQRAAAAMAPFAADHRQAGDRMHGDRTIQMPGEAIAAADERPFGPAIERGELLDLIDAEPGDLGRPGRAARRQMGFQCRRIIGKGRHIGPIGMAVAKQHMHERAGQSGIGARLEREVQVRRRRRAGAIGIDHDQPGAARFAGGLHMGHDMNMGRHRIAAPDDQQIGRAHGQRIGAAAIAVPGAPAGHGQGRAERGVHAAVALDVAQAVDAVALHMAHGAGIVIRPDAFAAKAPFGVEERLGDALQRLVPADRLELSGALRAAAQQGPAEARGMVVALGVAGDLGADHAGGIGVGGAAAHLAQMRAVALLDLERTRARTIMRADAGRPSGSGRARAEVVHGLSA